ncbi:MAG: response regulator transcription factor [Peptostreptococcaceae bacterium]|nr:response regulator transcription factor [Peptostreptococcaceae bacterium]
MSLKVLIVDDEENIVELLRFNMEQNGYRVEFAYDGEEALHKASAFRPELILLDVMLPKMDGVEVCRRIRQDERLKEAAIIMLTAKNVESDKIIGLEAGADDYITKPFSVNELIARIKAVNRRVRHQPFENEKLIYEDLEIDLANYLASKNGSDLDLTLKEFELLKLLVLNRGKVMNRNELLDRIWGYEYFGDPRTVDVHIRHLRKKIEDDAKQPQYIHTVRGVGYRLN